MERPQEKNRIGVVMYSQVEFKATGSGTYSSIARSKNYKKQTSDTGLSSTSPFPTVTPPLTASLNRPSKPKTLPTKINVNVVQAPTQSGAPLVGQTHSADFIHPNANRPDSALGPHSRPLSAHGAAAKIQRQVSSPEKSSVARRQRQHAKSAGSKMSINQQSSFEGTETTQQSQSQPKLTGKTPSQKIHPTTSTQQGQTTKQSKNLKDNRQAQLFKRKEKFREKEAGFSTRILTMLKKLFPAFFVYVNSDNVEFDNEKVREIAEALDLSQKEIKHFRTLFETIDIDGSGTIDPAELFEILEEKKGPYADALFTFLDMDGNGALDFEEFVLSFLIYCTYDRDDILRFCFQIFDKDSSGTIDDHEFLELAKFVNSATPLFPGNFKSALELFDANEDGFINFDEFKEMDRRFPLVFFPAFRLQDRMRRKTLGIKVWDSIEKEIRYQQNKERYAEANGGQPPEDLSDSIKRKYLPFLWSKRRIDLEVINKYRPSRKR